MQMVSCFADVTYRSNLVNFFNYRIWDELQLSLLLRRPEITSCLAFLIKKKHNFKVCFFFSFFQELVKFYQDNMMNTSFLGLDTTLKFPYKDPKFFPNSSRSPPSTVHRQSLPNLAQVVHPSPLSRNQTFSHVPHVNGARRSSGPHAQVLSE